MAIVAGEGQDFLNYRQFVRDDGLIAFHDICEVTDPDLDRGPEMCRHFGNSYGRCIPRMSSSRCRDSKASGSG